MSPTISEGLAFRRARIFASLLALFGLIAVLITPTPSLAVGGTTGSLRGQLLDPGSSAPVANVAVTATAASGVYKATTDANGRFNLLQIPSDTYVLSFEKQGYESQTVTGVTVLGDATVDLGRVTLSKSLRTIGRVSARAPTSAFQPSQTQDTYTVSGQRITQALGNEYSTNESTLLQSVPGVIPTFDTSGGAGLSVRGSLATELGYQFDGVPFSAPFFDENGSRGFLNNIAGGTGGSLQVVSGAGDATQGNSGGGTINTVAPRGSYPGA
ncbi:MAG: TonB-dependent receptor, partial [Candidatus Eremiobacteraeota bacterium]|nr:TonB-dependent receptor [Candidatus Eremiobacteraeota bacterium]